MGPKVVMVHEVDGGMASAFLDGKQIGTMEPDLRNGVYNWQVDGPEGGLSEGFVRMADIGSDEDNLRATQAYQKMLEGFGRSTWLLTTRSRS